MTKLIGTGTNQVPTNADLGTMAYQDVESVKVEAFESNGIDDNADATAITISSSGTTAFSGYPNPIVSISSIDTTVGSTDRLLDLNFVDSDSSEGYYIKFSDNDGEVGAIRATGASGVRFVTGNGGGIDFSATADTTASGASMTSELLDDYEEGTWTPSFPNIGTGTVTLYNNTYVKVGNLVTIQLEFNMSTLGTASGHLIVNGLPFSSNQYIYIGQPWTNGWASNAQNIQAWSSSSTRLSFYIRSQTSVSDATHAHIGGGGNVYMTFVYHTA